MIAALECTDSPRRQWVFSRGCGNAGLKPNDVTFVAVLSACAHAGLVHQAREAFLHEQRLPSCAESRAPRLHG
ncbi:hypothetical protein HPP92_009691 [Vanilla planifolia]|uniref:Uncharacterized protein n=1 Tax=Vanilla planifolia TaxID=51239 RepID=A0A835RG83_VANPL|nr:hypothetical protein HPP92_009691 [Vanilla planifolia]